MQDPKKERIRNRNSEASPNAIELALADCLWATCWKYHFVFIEWSKSADLEYLRRCTPASIDIRLAFDYLLPFPGDDAEALEEIDVLPCETSDTTDGMTADHATETGEMQA